jgi:DNA-directed RNA polymerase specialized sigma24 family protein
MGEGERAARAEPLADVDWRDVFARAAALARSFVREQDIDDVVTEGITRLYEGTAAYDPEVDGELAMRVVEVGRDAIRGEQRRVQLRTSGNFAAGVALALHGAALPGPEQALSEAELREQKAEILRQVRADCEGDAGATAVIDCALRAIERREDQARVTGLSYEDVRSAVKRVKTKLRSRQGARTVVLDE